MTLRQDKGGRGQRVWKGKTWDHVGRDAVVGRNVKVIQMETEGSAA